MGDFNPANYEDDFLADLVGFVASDDFQQLFEKFFLKYSVEFEYGEEQKLRYYEIYQDFHDMFESKLEEFCQSKGVSQAEFLKRCREASCTDEKSKLYMNILLSSVEYETFVKLMYIMKPVAERKLQMESESKQMDERYGNDVGMKGESKSSKQSDDDMKEMDDLRISDNADFKQSHYDDDDDYKSGNK
eukprot:TRINITY_DN35250_c0_g1_i1.p1 TRINITY_DN35250_c0_g1~~TRINITY_DN35250_c0_g1_i1.p1  ORF type:complete len:189 (-),score=16.24 TRINITY_DN35250_c0_g1_i1:74-640(-)